MSQEVLQYIAQCKGPKCDYRFQIPYPMHVGARTSPIESTTSKNFALLLCPKCDYGGVYTFEELCFDETASPSPAESSPPYVSIEYECAERNCGIRGTIHTPADTSDKTLLKRFANAKMNAVCQNGHPVSIVKGSHLKLLKGLSSKPF